VSKVRQGLIISATDRDVIARARKQYDSIMDMPHPPPSTDIENILSHLYERRHEVIRPAERTPAITFTPQLCVKCSRCVRCCADVINIGALDDPTVPLSGGACVSCGLCALLCPTDGIAETSSTAFIYQALGAGKTLGAIVDPAACVSFNEALDCGTTIGADVTPKVIGALHALGFRYVFDGRTGIDTAISELGEQLSAKRRRPFIISSCPAFVDFIAKNEQHLLGDLGLVRSPAQVTANMVHTRNQSRVLVYVTSCIAAKVDCLSAGSAIAAALTVREVVKLLNDFGIDWATVRDAPFDDAWEPPSGGSALTALSGGWTRAILSYVHERETRASAAVQDPRDRGARPVNRGR
jgi:iron only hydrogenase large subunit-like protein